ncbi:MAG: ethanolamine utilization protein EutH [Clostridia bacterium]|nr:ethanolamine utilization protein EutH [Clostridia bacterium]
MNYLTIIILIFSVLGALDRIIGNRFGIGREFEKAFMLLGTMALSMIGMIVISPFIAELMKPLSEGFVNVLHIDPSIIPASLFANDMGGASLSVEMATDDKIGMYNALIVSSMMGCTISFTIPFALGVVDKSQHKELLLGLLCGIVTIPLGCIVSGVVCGIPFISLLLVLMPLVIFSGIIAFGLIKFPDFCIKAFKVFGIFITILITIGLALGIIRFLTGFEVIKGLATIEEGASICVNAAIVLSGSFPFMFILAKVLSKPLKVIAKKIGVNEYSIVGIVSCLATSATTFGMMDKMDKKGVVLNSAFTISGAFVLGSHLAFTMAFDGEYVIPVIIGKLISGVLAIFLANIIFHKTAKTD